VLRYFGGKWELAPWVISYFPAHHTYTEVFGGAGSVLFQKERAEVEIYNDLDSRLVNVMRHLQDEEESRRLQRKLSLTPWSREEFERACAVLDQPCNHSSDVLAWATIVVSFQGHGSGGLRRELCCGWRAKDDGANGHAAHAWVNYPREISAFCERLRGVVIEHRDALEVLPVHDRRDALHYVDPPYVQSERKSKHRYTKDFDDAAHRELSKVLHKLKGAVVLSGYPSPFYDKLYRTWRREIRPHRSVMGGERTECIWLNARAAAHSRNLFA
jgi:DNA adenine methylase